MLERNKDVVRAFFKAVGQGNGEAAAALLSPDVIVMSAVPGTSITAGTRRLPEVIETIAGLSKCVSGGIDFEEVAITAEDDRVSIWLKGHSTLITGDAYNNQYHNLLTLRDGKIVQMRELYCTKLVDEVIVPLVAGKR